MIRLWGDISDGDVLDAIASTLSLVSIDWCGLPMECRPAASSVVYASAKAQYSIRLWRSLSNIGFTGDSHCGIIVYIYDGDLVIDQLDTLSLNDPKFIDNLMYILGKLEDFGFAYDRYVVEKWQLKNGVIIGCRMAFDIRDPLSVDKIVEYFTARRSLDLANKPVV